MSSFSQSLPWWLRIGAKIVLARLPIPYSFWKRLRLFEHGDMNQPLKAWSGFLEHARTAGVLHEESALPYLCVDSDFTVLELGPGDSLFSAVIALTLNASPIWLVDAGAFATTDMAAYTSLFSFLRLKGYTLPFKKEPNTITELLTACNGHFLTEGIRSLEQIPSASIAYCFSNAVLEHVPKHDFTKMAQELFRIVKPDGVCVHRVDLKDHLGGGLNNLRFSEVVWEGSLFSGSGFYTNRIRFNEMLNIFSQAGFVFTMPRILRWEHLPLSRTKMDAAFSQLSDDELLVSGFDVVLKKPSNRIC
jgi:SAM-dependent methyltransferase